MTERSSLLLEVGRVSRAHGLGGEVLIKYTSDRPERRQPGAELQVGDRWHVVESIRPHTHGEIVKLESVDGREAAERLGGLVVRAMGITADDELWVDELIGKTVVDQHGDSHGVVVAVVANPASDLLELQSGALVPLRFLDERADTELRVCVPDGLFELFEGE